MVTIMYNKIISKTNEGFFCEFCYYYTSRRANYARHCLTRTHMSRKNDNIFEQKGVFTQNEQICSKRVKTSKNRYKCPKCDKRYKYASGLSRHKKGSCNKGTVMLLIEENKKLKEEVQKLKEIPPSAPSIINSNNTTNNISINVFLNEHCKNAIPMLDFVRNLKFKLHDIDPDRPASSIESLTNLIINQLQQLEDTKRPVHCSDAKRLKFYVKDASGWVKDDDNIKIDKAMGFANMRHQGAWHAYAEENGFDKAVKDDYYLKMNIAMGEWSDNVKKAKKKVKKEMSEVTNLKKALAEKNRGKNNRGRFTCPSPADGIV
jgi:hypothetical protein